MTISNVHTGACEPCYSGYHEDCGGATCQCYHRREAIRVDIGGGTRLAYGHVNLDPVHGVGELRRRAQDVPWPYDDATVDAVRASHVMEHIPAGADRIAVMNEAWRVLRPGARFDIVVPLFPSWQAVADPTHVSFWVRESFDYFTHAIAPNADYDIHRWTMTRWDVIDGWEAHARMEKP